MFPVHAILAQVGDWSMTFLVLRSDYPSSLHAAV